MPSVMLAELAQVRQSPSLRRSRGLSNSTTSSIEGGLVSRFLYLPYPIMLRCFKPLPTRELRLRVNCYRFFGDVDVCSPPERFHRAGDVRRDQICSCSECTGLPCRGGLAAETFIKLTAGFGQDQRPQQFWMAFGDAYCDMPATGMTEQRYRPHSQGAAAVGRRRRPLRNGSPFRSHAGSASRFTPQATGQSMLTARRVTVKLLCPREATDGTSPARLEVGHNSGTAHCRLHCT